MKFSFMFFSSASYEEDDPYKFPLDVARYADVNNFHSVWVPERHFDEFGGIFTNPPITLAAFSTITNQVQLRAGSYISPLHNTIRSAENWSVLDNLSKGRVGISFGSGWNVNDFIFFPDRYKTRHSIMYSQIEEMQRLWSGSTIEKINSYGKSVPIQLFPKPYSNSLPIWITSSGHPDTYVSAGRYGANILTHMINQDISTLKERISTYKDARQEHGYDRDSGEITLMLHTFIAPTEEKVLEYAKKPFREYLRSAVKLENKAAKGGGSISGGLQCDAHDIPTDLMEELLDITFEKYYSTASLVGTIDKCKLFLKKIKEVGVTEVACLIDFGVEPSIVMSHLDFIQKLKNECDVMNVEEVA